MIVVIETIPFPDYLLHSLHFTSSHWSYLTITVSWNKLCQTGALCGCARQRRTAVLLRTVLCAVVPAVFPLSDFPLLGRSFAEVLKLMEAIQWQAIHMCKYISRPHKQWTWKVTSSLQQRKHYEYPVVGTHISHSPCCTRLTVGKVEFFP